MGLMGAFFLKYLLQITLVSNAIQLLDLPHFIVKSLKKCCHKNKSKKEPYVDTWFFDLGYH